MIRHALALLLLAAAGCTVRWGNDPQPAPAPAPLVVPQPVPVPVPVPYPRPYRPWHPWR